MKSLYNSATANNLIEAFRTKAYDQQKYSNYAAVALEQGYIEISNFFEQLAQAVNEHSRLMGQFLLCSGYEPSAIATGELKPIFTGDTKTNLSKSLEYQQNNIINTYPKYMKKAYDEKYLEVAVLLGKIMRADDYFLNEIEHFLEMLKKDTYYTKDTPHKWVCSRCGYTYVGNTPPKYCPLCSKEQQYYKITQ